ncbi:glycoside hydrolase family 17 protein [Dissoconium aciculare CBS 342.82]|uniref:Probable glucan endo-1,3-beta-glucosidase eglC n=1 Tax=Dissoconium aciculare CBS 342.82 TaxID=1314786 RepID=A0A6J3M977_9PEZI|nr:glycoside hydrolase family 17 protein [Dissoconium aciculare CBS 342.82]KAF1824169.1 glycoside hydrolase family 17 protein [Dissoconium aciculare CBS 342.82]
MLFPNLLALVGTVAAVQQGFNYGSTNNDGSPKLQQDFQNEFTRAKNLQGTSGFTSARLYTMIQGGTANTVISAIPAAINTRTGLLLGLWTSAGQSNFDNEIIALKQAIEQYGNAFIELVEGISVGSEDLYRISPTGIINKSGAGANPDDLVKYIQQVRNAISGTPAASKPIGHVDTWTAWVNGSNAAVVNAVDWLGFDGYPYFQNTQANGIENGAELLFESYNATVAASQGKPVWITETGWPVSGPTENQAVASPENAARYWQDVACRVLGNIPTYWYTLQDAYPSTPSPSFGIVGQDLNSAPFYDLSCKNSNASPKAYGTSYNGTISPTVSSIFNFDIPASYAGKTCSLVFLFPEISHLETSSYSFNNKGGLAIAGLVAPATEQTSFSSVPATNGQKASIERVVPGNNYSVLTQKCPAGQRISYTFSSAGGLDVNFFQDYNPSPLGVYVAVC